METISQVLFWVANSLLIPDILLLLLLFSHFFHNLLILSISAVLRLFFISSTRMCLSN